MAKLPTGRGFLILVLLTAALSVMFWFRWDRPHVTQYQPSVLPNGILEKNLTHPVTQSVSSVLRQDSVRSTHPPNTRKRPDPDSITQTGGGGASGMEEKNHTDVSRISQNQTSDHLLPTTVPIHNKQIYLTVFMNGRLGNQMFEFASTLGTARLHGLTPAIPTNNMLRRIFNITVADIDEKIAFNLPHVGQKRGCCRFDPIRADFRVNSTLYGYFQSWRYFANILPELRHIFTFKEHILNSARACLKMSVEKQHNHISLSNTTFVGIHVRRGDMLKPHSVKFGYKVGSKDYLLQAMSFFLVRYQLVMFVVCSTDMEWTKTVIPPENATFITDQAAEVDMAILSLCNHTILTVGSFGWWAGWLAGGITTYQIQQVSPGTVLDSRFNLTDYMFPGWIGLNQSFPEKT